MSKGNMLLGQARGKVGSLVFSRSNGKQIVRSRAEVVKNPQTEKQTIQRIIMNTIAQAYSKTAAITDHSFEGVQPGAKTMAAFMKANINALRASVMQQVGEGSFFYEIYDFSPIGSNVFVPNGYIISKGQLPTIDVVDNNADDSLAMALSANTYQAVIDEYGLQRGDQITFVTVCGRDVKHCGFKFARVILDPVDADGVQLPLSTALIADGAINKPNPRNEGEFTALSYTAGKVVFSFHSLYNFAGGIIVSRQKTDGTWMRSNCTLFANPANSDKAYSLQDALDAFYSGGIDTLNSLYLNNSGTGALANSGESGDSGNSGGSGAGTGGDLPEP